MRCDCGAGDHDVTSCSGRGRLRCLVCGRKQRDHKLVEYCFVTRYVEEIIPKKEANLGRPM